MELLILLPVVGLALGWQRWQQTTAASAMLHTVSAMIAILFIASLLGLLLPASILLMAGGTLAAVVEMRRHIRDRIALPVPIGMFAILACLYWTVHSGSSLLFYDEYSHWGIFLKEMLAHDALWGADTNSMHPRYLPGATLWQYFFAVFSGNQEGAAYLAQFTLLMTPLLVLWERLGWRDYAWHAGTLVAVIAALSNFGHGLTSLYVDHILGAWFAGILLNYLLELESRTVRQRLSYLLPLVLVVLIKTTGVFFVLANAGIIALLLLLVPDQKTAVTSGARWLRSIAFPLAALALCVTLILVWNANRDSAAVGAGEGSAGEIVSHLAAGESIFDESEQAELTRRFIEVVLHQQISKDEVSAQLNAFSYPAMPMYDDTFRLTTASLLGLSLIAFFLSWRTIVAAEYRYAWAIAAGCVWLTALAYIFVLYFGYRFVSATTNGMVLSSYVRYAHSMLLPVVLFCFAPLLPAFAGRQLPRVALNEKLSVSRNSLVFAVSLAVFLFLETPYVQPLYVTQQPPEFRTQTEALTTRLRDAIGESSLWVLFPNDFSNGLIGQILQYQLTPGRTYVEQDATVMFGSQEALRAELRNWEYAWFPASDPEIDAAIERLVGKPVIERVYRIDSSGQQLRLLPVPGIFQGNQAQD